VIRKIVLAFATLALVIGGAASADAASVRPTAVHSAHFHHFRKNTGNHEQIIRQLHRWVGARNQSPTQLIRRHQHDWAVRTGRIEPSPHDILWAKFCLRHPELAVCQN